MSKDKCSKEEHVSGIKKLRELIKRNKTAVGVVVVFALAFALILTSIIISTYSPLVSSEISADGLLSYIGALLGAAATICAVRITIVNERNRQEEDRIISAKPWLASETLMLCSNEDIQEEENGMTTFVALNGNLFGSSKAAPWEVKKGTHEINKTDCIIKYEIMNAGGNTASRLQLTLDGYPLFPDFALAKDHVKKIIFVLPLREGEKQSRYVLKFKYGDIVSPTTYSQIETLNIVQDEYGVTFSQSMDDLLTAPKKENKSGQDEI